MDQINALFELGGFFAVLPSIAAIWRDKAVRGASVWTPLFFTGWGAWNLVYYPHLGQSWSFAAAALLTTANAVYLGLFLRWSRG